MTSIYEKQTKLDFGDILILPRESNITSRSLVDLNSKHLRSLLKVDTNGIIAANMDGVGTFEIAVTLKNYGVLTALHKHHDVYDLAEHFSTEDSSHSFYSLGTSIQDYEKIVHFNQIFRGTSTPIKICIDVANGYMSSLPEFCLKIKSLIPESIIMVGNVVDYSTAKKLQSTCNILKVGIGQGSNCLTRTQTGIGYPQFSAVYDICRDYDGKLREDIMTVCSDGGCVTPGDISKAFAAGAKMVMLGGMLAGTDRGGGDIIEVNGQKYVEFYGMSSATAQKKHNGGLKEYRSSEGRTTLIPYKGDINNVIKNILGGIRSTCTYVGAETIDDLAPLTDFIKVNSVINKSMEKYTVGM